MCELIQRAVIPVIETLEGRVLLSASIQGTTLMVEGNATAPNKINVSYVRKTHSVRVVENRVRQDFPAAGLTAIQIDGGASKDIIVVRAGVSLPTTINGMGGNDQITGGAENDTIVTGQGSSVIHPGLGHNSIDLTLGTNRAILARKAVDTIIATKQDKIVGATKTTQIEAPITPSGAPLPPAPPAPPAPPLPPAPQGPQKLVPGNGFAGPTPQPAHVGSGYGATENAIARWDVVPDQTFSGSFDVGVVAFHLTGIKYVSFSVNGGAWVNVSQMTLNPQTNVVEYWAFLNAGDFSEGQVEVRAIAVPNAGVPRVLQGPTPSGQDSLFLFADPQNDAPHLVRYVSTTGSDVTGDGTQGNPFGSIIQAAMSIQQSQGSVDGGIIYLMPGTYQVVAGEWYQTPTTTDRWLTVSAAPGSNKSDVVITGSIANSAGNDDGLQTSLVKITDLTLNGLVYGSGKITDTVWYDNVAMVGPGRYAGESFRENQFDYKYITDSTISNMQDAPDAINLYRDVQISEIAQSGFHNSPLVINSTISDVNPGSNTTLHADVYQFTVQMANSICYGMTAVDGIVVNAIRMQPSALDAAIVDTNITTPADTLWEMERPYQNILMDDCVLDGNIVYDQTFSAIDIQFEGCTFPAGAPGSPAGVLID